jgi:hypothetical protein
MKDQQSAKQRRVRKRILRFFFKDGADLELPVNPARAWSRYETGEAFGLDGDERFKA